MNAQKEALKTGRLDQALAALAGHIEAPCYRLRESAHRWRSLRW
jgi:hypothetical protein